MQDNINPTTLMQKEIDNTLYTENQVSQLLGYTPRALQKWRITGDGPKFVKVSQRSIRYRKIDILQWIEERIRTSTSDPGPDMSCE
jgi:predicted DNA-binding transcriptional regulator AlpA